jgi:uncharacterized membrane protein YwzB
MGSLVILVVLLVCIGLAWWGIQAAFGAYPTMPPPIKAAVIIIFVIVAISVLLNWAGVWGAGGGLRHW